MDRKPCKNNYLINGIHELSLGYLTVLQPHSPVGEVLSQKEMGILEL
jgi:hypothetical protein